MIEDLVTLTKIFALTAAETKIQSGVMSWLVKSAMAGKPHPLAPSPCTERG